MSQENELIERALQASIDAGLALDGEHGVAAARHAARFVLGELITDGGQTEAAPLAMQIRLQLASIAPHEAAALWAKPGVISAMNKLIVNATAPEPQPEVTAEPVAFLDASGQTMLTEYGIKWFTEYLENARPNPVGHAAAPLYATPSVVEEAVKAERSTPDDAVAELFVDAWAEAEKAMRKFPQPNYVISKVAEEAGEVVKAAIHCAEGRDTPKHVAEEIRQAMAMLIRLYIEGDQVHGLPPIASALSARSATP